VPFTLAHAAAALPSRRLHLIPSAVVVGTFAPDFEYFLRFAPDRGFGHTAKGILELSFPLAILVLWIFHTFVKIPVSRLLPDGMQRRLTNLHGFSFRGVKQLALIGISILLGIVTHVLWDSFTHPYYWPYRHWLLLRETVRVPVLGSIPYFKLFQHGSTVLGLAIVSLWLIRWYQTTEPCSDPLSAFPKKKEIAIACLVVGVSFIGGIVRAMNGTGGTQHFLSAKFVGETIVTAIALAWWQLVVYGLVATFKVLPRGSGAVAR
jgi:Domain of unknown function (DUF4184)